MTIKGTTARTKSSIEKHLKATVNMHVASIMGLRKCEKIPKTDAGFQEIIFYFRENEGHTKF